MLVGQGAELGCGVGVDVGEGVDGREEGGESAVAGGG